MAIRIQCGGCKKFINAPEKLAGTSRPCPGCGAAVSIPSLPVAATEAEVLTIEATSKKWKLIQLIGGAGIVVATISLAFDLRTAVGDPTVNFPLGWFTMGLLILSIPVYVIGRVGAWWYHG
ncbi:hypothetical protein [Lacipirellula limnantheis]|uniref:Uncharacterized protein n=1 Tax=Lacipirellula limnantheis TaxID=2528024 RepID=A0A517U5V8_9BACT|nr:hypothetical protein [Lacipirellula limnantheis]QDT76016.1 hypothetical protein I41_52610 [Lacipirellula limnantheis]